MRKRRRAYRSGFENRVLDSLKEEGKEFEYEKVSFIYTTTHKYTPDLLLPNGIYVELKGFLDKNSRSKMKAVKLQHPDIDLRIVFQDASKPIYTGSKTTFGQWATQHNFIWAEGSIPKEWWDK